MQIKPDFRKSLAALGTEYAMVCAPLLSRSGILRSSLIQAMQLYTQHFQVSIEPSISRPAGVDEDRDEFSRAIWKTADRILEQNLAPSVLRNAGRNLVDGIMIESNQQKAMGQFKERFGINPPGFLTISPGKMCNLRCKGCYANAGENSEKLDWNVFDRIIQEAKTLWGIRFIVISGGEPLAYRSLGKGVLDAAEKHPDVFFLMYTNGTLIDKNVAKRIARLGNITPALSVEGWREQTDERRGEGVYDSIIESMGMLRDAGVPFGISLTATRHNVKDILSDEFIDYFFKEQRALYGWMFHYMPIGRSYTLDLMPTPEQRVWMWKRVWEIIRQKQIFLADFWNHGTLSDGCLAAGRSDGGGYFYIDWNGTVSPCVFVPYSPANICQYYAQGKDLNDMWENHFFYGIREWQNNYRKRQGNWLAPCINRDHYQSLRKLIAQHEPDPIDENAHQALMDHDYATGMKEYGQAYRLISNPIWEEIYLKKSRQN